MYPFFHYYGGKWRAARHYPRPTFKHVVEPFAGAAGYAVYWEPKQVTLVERNPLVAGLWRYLIKVSPNEILRLPDKIEDISQIRCAQEAKHLIGFWVEQNGASPAKYSRGGYHLALQQREAVGTWGKAVKFRIAKQLERIKHWKIIEGSYEDVGNPEAFWFIDPPYQVRGATKYLFGSNKIDFEALAAWVKERRGGGVVCENEGAEWLPFVSWRGFRAMNLKQGEDRVSKEVVYLFGKTSNGLFG